MAKEQLKEQLWTKWQGSTLPAPWDKAEPGRPMGMSHRAGGNEAPENTLAALRHAEKAGSRVMQMDILPTVDGIPVVFHDINMRRATGVDIDIREASRNSSLQSDIQFSWFQFIPCRLGSRSMLAHSSSSHTYKSSYSRRVQVPSSSLPPYKDILDPLLPLEGAHPIHTRDFQDGQRIPTLAALLEAVSGHSECSA